MISIEELTKIKLLNDFPREDLTRIAPLLRCTTFSAGTTVIYRGDPGYSMFLILGGSVAVTLVNDEGHEYTIATLEEGDVFGEIALMTGEPRSANIRALTDIRLAELFQDDFNELIALYPSLKSGLFRLLARRLEGGGTDKELDSKELIANLLGFHKKPESDLFPGKTKWVQELNDRIAALASENVHVLFVGEKGSGKLLAAELIHFRGSGAGRPLLHLDCANPPPIQREAPGGSHGLSDELHREMAQESALFGHGADVAGYAKGIRHGFLELADGGTLILENAELLTPHNARLLSGYMENSRFQRKGDTRPLKSRVRIVATAEDVSPPDETVRALISGHFAAATVPLKPLRERKKDIPLIARQLMEQANRKFRKNVTEISNDAMNALLDHDWPLNIDEMNQTMERAVAVTSDSTINIQQVFLNLPSYTTIGKLNLLRIPLVSELANQRLVPGGLTMVTVPFIIFTILYTMIGPQERNPANLMAWAILWPFLVFSIATSSRSWCSYCPFPVISNGVNAFRTRFRTIPESIGRSGIWMGIIGFLLIINSEHAADMFNRPRATAILLLVIIGGVIITNAFFGKRSWCKYICPLGKMIGLFSTASLVELGSNSNVCSGQCQSFDCVKENNCPMGLHPSVATVSKDCVFCFACIRKCPHKSIHIDAHLPWQRLLAKVKWDFADSFFSVALTASVIAAKLPSWGPLDRFLADRLAFLHQGNILGGLAVSGTIILAYLAVVLLASGFPAGTSWKRYFTLCGDSYLFLAMTGFLNVYLHEFVYRGHNLIPWTLERTGLDRIIPPGMITPDLGTLRMLIPLITLGGLAVSLYVLRKIARRQELPGTILNAHRVLLCASAGLFLVII